MSAPLLIFAVGNPSRGDDALGPALIEALRSQGLEDEGGVELMWDFQWQVEHALDLAGRRAVLFVDAALPAALPAGADGAALAAIQPEAERAPASHALRPQAVLSVLQQVMGMPPPPASLLAIQGHAFALGEGLSEPARVHLARALQLAQGWLARA